MWNHNLRTIFASVIIAGASSGPVLAAGIIDTTGPTSNQQVIAESNFDMTQSTTTTIGSTGSTDQTSASGAVNRTYNTTVNSNGNTEAATNLSDTTTRISITQDQASVAGKGAGDQVDVGSRDATGNSVITPGKGGGSLGPVGAGSGAGIAMLPQVGATSTIDGAKLGFMNLPTATHGVTASTRQKSISWLAQLVLLSALTGIGLYMRQRLGWRGNQPDSVS